MAPLTVFIFKVDFISPFLYKFDSNVFVSIFNIYNINYHKYTVILNHAGTYGNNKCKEHDNKFKQNYQSILENYHYIEWLFRIY